MERASSLCSRSAMEGRKSVEEMRVNPVPPGQTIILHLTRYYAWSYFPVMP